nr:MAG TPA: hypothetical protein [Caudoviricetes sp.]
MKSKVLNTKWIKKKDLNGRIIYSTNTDDVKPSFFREPPLKIFIQNNETMKMSEWYLDFNKWNEIKELPHHRWKEFNGELLYIYRPKDKFVKKFPELEGAEFHVFKGLWYMTKAFKAGHIHTKGTTLKLKNKAPENLEKNAERRRVREEQRANGTFESKNQLHKRMKKIKRAKRKEKNILKNEKMYQANLEKKRKYLEEKAKREGN